MRIFTFIGIMAIAIGLATGCGGGDDEDNLGLRTARTTEAATEQVTEMVGTLDKLAPPGAVADGLERGEAPEADAASVAIAYEGIDTEARAAEIMASDDSEVRKAFDLMRLYAEDDAVGNDKYVLAVKQLREAWTPLYEKAHADYAKMNDRIGVAKATAEAYFERQEALTARINDSEFKAELREHDRRQREVFVEWSGKAEGLAETAYNMMRRMQDINVYIVKTDLSAHFMALQGETSQLPVSMTDLNQQLDEFKAATWNLNESIANGSSPNGD